MCHSLRFIYIFSVSRLSLFLANFLYFPVCRAVCMLLNLSFHVVCAFYFIWTTKIRFCLIWNQLQRFIHIFHRFKKSKCVAKYSAFDKYHLGMDEIGVGRKHKKTSQTNCAYISPKANKLLNQKKTREIKNTHARTTKRKPPVLAKKISENWNITATAN